MPIPLPDHTSPERRVRVLLVEDEPLGLEKLHRFVGSDPRVELVGHAMSGNDAVNRIRELRPDLVFLDIQLPGYSGFEVLRRLGEATPRAVVFVTAHDEFAAHAFEVNAVDHVLKPLTAARIRSALHRALDRLATQTTEEATRQLTNLLTPVLSTIHTAPQRLSIRSKGRILLLAPEDIDWVGAAKTHVEVHVARTVHVIGETINSLESRLPAEDFLRISRSAIVNRHRVRELQPLLHGQFAVFLLDGTRLTLTRSFRHRLSQLGCI